MGRESEPTLAQLAAQVRATDVFVLVPVDDGRLFNVDGVGRGEGWAGNVTLLPAEEPILSRAASESHVVIDGRHSRRVFGPYWARRAAAVALDGTVIVFGGDDLEVAEGKLSEVASAIRRQAFDTVPPTKLEADEAEIDQARRSVHQGGWLDAGGRALHLASAAASALGCEFAAVYLPDRSHSPFIADLGWRPAASPEEIAAAILPLWHASRLGTLVEQDVSQSARVHRPLGWDDGVVSAAAAPLGSDGSAGVLIVAHTGIRPRGFTDLCARVLEAVGEAGTELLSKD